MPTFNNSFQPLESQARLGGSSGADGVRFLDRGKAAPVVRAGAVGGERAAVHRGGVADVAGEAIGGPARI